MLHRVTTKAPLPFITKSYATVTPKRTKKYSHQQQQIVFRLDDFIGSDNFEFIQYDLECYHSQPDPGFENSVCTFAESIKSNFPKYHRYYKSVANRQSSCCELGPVVFLSLDHILSIAPLSYNISVTHSKKHSIIRFRVIFNFCP